MTALRHPLTPQRKLWPPAAVDFFNERVAILEADRIPNAEALADAMTRRWWALGNSEMFQHGDW